MVSDGVDYLVSSEAITSEFWLDTRYGDIVYENERDQDIQAASGKITERTLDKMKLYEKIEAGAVYFIAEMSANHAGNLKNALDIVHAAKKAGADCIKVQTYTADTMTLDCDLPYFKVKGGLWDGYALYDLYREASLPWEWQKQIKEEAEGIGLDFLSTPFDATSVDLFGKPGCPDV